MKKFMYLLLSAMLTMTFVACSNDDDEGTMIYDWPGINICFYVQDAQENNLLDTTVANNIIDAPVQVQYNGKTYDKDVVVNEHSTRAYLATLHGLTTQKDKDGRLYLNFGELQGDDTYVNEPITIQWGDGTYDTVTMNSKIVWKGNKAESVRSFMLNGEPYEPQAPYYSFVIIKK